MLFCTLLCALFSLSLSLPRSVSRAISDHCCYTVPMLLLILCVLSTRFFSFFLFYYFILYIFCCMFICYRIVFFLFRYCCCCSWLLLLLLEKRGWKAHGSSKCWALTLCVWVYLWMHAIFNRRSFVCSFVNLFSCAIVRLCVYCIYMLRCCCCFNAAQCSSALSPLEAANGPKIVRICLTSERKSRKICYVCTNMYKIHAHTHSVSFSFCMWNNVKIYIYNITQRVTQIAKAYEWYLLFRLFASDASCSVDVVCFLVHLCIVYVLYAVPFFRCSAIKKCTNRAPSCVCLPASIQ